MCIRDSYKSACTFETCSGVLGEDGKMEQPTVKTRKPKSSDEVVALGEVTSSTLKRVPLALTVNLESVEAVALLDRRAK